MKEDQTAMSTEQTLVLLKPDAVARGLIPVLLGRLQQAGLIFKKLELRTPAVELAEEHYQHLQARGEDIFRRNASFIAGKPVVALVVEGVEAIRTVRKLIGPTEPVQAPAGTLRGDFSSDSIAAAEAEGRGLHNLIHASDSPETAAREIGLWFP